MYSVPLLAQLNDKVFNSLKAIFSFPALRSISVTGSDQFRHDMSFELMGIVESKDAQSLERAYFSLLNSRHSGFFYLPHTLSGDKTAWSVPNVAWPDLSTS